MPSGPLAHRVPPSPTSTCVGRRAMKASLPPRMASSSTACSKGRYREGLGKGRRQGGRPHSRVRRRRRKFTGRFWHYVFEANGHAIGDFNMRTPRRASSSSATTAKAPLTRPAPAGSGAKIALPTSPNSSVSTRSNSPMRTSARRKVAYIDLLKIQDPNKKARKPLNDGVLTFPFFTIENVEVVDALHRGRQRQQRAVLNQPRSEQG